MHHNIIEKVSNLEKEDKMVLDMILQKGIPMPRYFNYKESEELCPWKVAYKKQQLTKLVESGRIKYKERAIVKTARIKITTERQVRTQKVDQDNASIVGLSLEVHKWLSEKEPIIVIELEDDPNFDYELILGFTRHQEITRLCWPECLVDVISGNELALYEAGCDSNLHIGGGGKKNTAESIYNLAIRLVKKDCLPEDEDDGENPVVKEWIYERLRDKTEDTKKQCYKDYMARRPSKTPAQTFHSDDTGENSIVLYAKRCDLPYGGNLNKAHGIGVITKNPRARAQWDKIDEMILKYPNYAESMTFAMWVPEINLNKKDDQRARQKESAKTKLKEKIDAIAVINKRVVANEGDPTDPIDIARFGYNIKFRHVAQDKTPNSLKGGEPMEEDGFV